MSDTPDLGDVKARRKALGWNRQTLSDRASLDKRVVQLIELGQWSEDGALGRIAYVLTAAENGDVDVQLPPVEAEEDAFVFGKTIPS